MPIFACPPSLTRALLFCLAFSLANVRDYTGNATWDSIEVTCFILLLVGFYCSLKQKQQQDKTPFPGPLNWLLDWISAQEHNKKLSPHVVPVQESNPNHFDGNKRSALSSLPQLLFAFCGIQVFFSWNSSFRQKNQFWVFENSRFRQKNQVCGSKESILYRVNQVCIE